jgi:hypothetical protein
VATIISRDEKEVAFTSTASDGEFANLAGVVRRHSAPSPNRSQRRLRFVSLPTLRAWSFLKVGKEGELPFIGSGMEWDRTQAESVKCQFKIKGRVSPEW